MKLGKINKLSIANTAYASVLTHIDIPPASLFIAGVLPNTRRISVAIIGSRRPTAYGEEVTHRLAADLSRYGVVIISGLALGVDAIAHTACLDAGGTTIAVMANGLHRIYPSSHTGLAKQITEHGGAVITEQEAGYEAKPYDFLARNRLVSGLADAVVVTEATQKSGTLSTVAHALAQNKEVFAVPGPITSLLSAGPNKLLQQGAHVALRAEDILQIIAPELLDVKTTRQTRLILGDTPAETAIITLIQKGTRDGEVLQKKSQLSASEFLQTLTIMELKGSIRALGANRWTTS
jgi:DNA processing protein